MDNRLAEALKALLAGAAALALGSCAEAPPVALLEGPMPEAPRSVLQTDVAVPFSQTYHQRSGCYEVGEHKFRFKVYPLPANSTEESRELLAKTVGQFCRDSVTLPRQGFYSYPLPVSGSSMMVLWKNVTTSEYGYAVVSVPFLGTKIVFGNTSTRARELGDNPTFQWTSGGRAITFRFRGTRTDSPNVLRGGSVFLFSMELAGAR